MEALIPLLVIGAIGYFVVQAVSKSSTQAKEGRARLREGGLEPDYAFEGRCYVSLEDASDSGGDHGLKIALAIYQKQRFIRVVLFKSGTVWDFRFDEVVDVRRETYPAGVYGKYPGQVIVIDVDHETFPLPQVIVYPGHYKHLDQLKAALQAPA